MRISFFPFKQLLGCILTTLFLTQCGDSVIPIEEVRECGDLNANINIEKVDLLDSLKVEVKLQIDTSLILENIQWYIQEENDLIDSFKVSKSINEFSYTLNSNHAYQFVVKGTDKCRKPFQYETEYSTEISLNVRSEIFLTNVLGMVDFSVITDDGLIIAIGSYGKIRVLNLFDGKIIKEFDTEIRSPRSPKLDSNNEFIYVIAENGIFKIDWQKTNTATNLGTLSVELPRDLDISADNSRLILCGRFGVGIYNLLENKLANSFLFDGNKEFVRFTPDREFFTVSNFPFGDKSGYFGIFKTETGEEVERIENRCFSGFFYDNTRNNFFSNRVCLSGESGIGMLNLKSKNTRTISACPVNFWNNSLDGKYVFSGNTIFNSESLEIVWQKDCNSGTHNTVSPSGKFFKGYYDNTYIVDDSWNEIQLYNDEKHDRGIVGNSLSFDKKLLLTYSNTEFIVWNLVTGSQEYKYKIGPFNFISVASFSQDNGIWIQTRNGFSKIKNSQIVIGPIANSGFFPAKILSSRDSEYIAILNSTDKIEIISNKSGEQIATINIDGSYLRSNVSFMNNSDSLVVYNETKQRIETWDFKNNTLIEAIEVVTTEQPQNLSIDEDDKLVSLFSYDAILVADLKKRKVVFEEYGKIVLSTKFSCFSPNSKLLATSIGNTIDVWNLKNKTKAFSQKMDEGVTGLYFPSNSQLFAIVGAKYMEIKVEL